MQPCAFQMCFQLLGSIQHAIPLNLKLLGLNLASVSKWYICEVGGVFFERRGFTLPINMMICLLQPWFFAVINAECISGIQMWPGWIRVGVHEMLGFFLYCGSLANLLAIDWASFSWCVPRWTLCYSGSHMVANWKDNEKANWTVPNKVLLLGDWGDGSCTSPCRTWGKVECFGQALSKDGSLCSEEMHFLCVQCLLSAWIAQWKHVQALLLCRNCFLRLCTFPVLLLFSPAKFHSCGLSPSRYLAVPSQMLTSLKWLIIRTVLLCRVFPERMALVSFSKGRSFSLPVDCLTALPMYKMAHWFCLKSKDV